MQEKEEAPINDAVNEIKVTGSVSKSIKLTSTAEFQDKVPVDMAATTLDQKKDAESKVNAVENQT